MFSNEEVSYIIIHVICDKCGSKRELGRNLTFDGRMNRALHIGYTFKEEDGTFKNYCPLCQKEGKRS